MSPTSSYTILQASLALTSDRTGLPIPLLLALGLPFTILRSKSITADVPK